MLRKTKRFLEQQHMAMPGEKIVLGLSGGADSVCLFHILRQLGYSLEAVHVNHGIRGAQADRDEQFVRMLCEGYKIPFHSFSFDVPAISKEKHLSLEEAGRMVRRQAFEEVLGKTKAKHIALAHHGNDQAETFLFHLSRGAGIRGLSAMKPVEGVYIRPFLWAQRKEIEEYIQMRGYEFVEDETNAGTDYTRNKIRHQVVPVLEEVNEKSVVHICSASQKLGEVAAFVEREAEKLFRASVKMQNNEVKISKDAFVKGDVVLWIPVLQKCIEQWKGSLKNFTEEHWNCLVELFSMQTGRELQLPYGIGAARTYEGIRIFDREEKDLPAAVEVNGEGMYEFEGMHFEVAIEPWGEDGKFPIKTYTKCFDYDKISQSVFFRTRETGDYLEINQNHGKKSLQDYLVNEKIPKEQRDKVILLADGSHILWVVGKRISEYYKVTSETKRILKVQMYGGNEHEF